MIELLERNRTARGIVLLIVGLLTVLIYQGGLHGPFLIDDVPNLDTIQRWTEGRLDWRSAIDNRSGPLGRGISMLTFLGDAARSGGMYPDTFKTTNLAIHILCGSLIYVFCRQLFRRVESTRIVASTAALFVAAWWLFIPLHVSTVLYIVQRMAQLSALFILLSLVIYVAIRQWMEQRESGTPQVILWIIFPLIVTIGAFAKENAVLALPLALLVELTLFGRPNEARRPASVTAFFLLTVALPGVIVGGWLASHPHVLTDGYLTRPFTFSERVLTEPRVLWSYVKSMLLPVGQDMGLFHDTYVLSTGLLTPWTTLPAIGGWVGSIILAIVCHKRLPLVALGIGFFLIGHVLESTIVPIEIYFEHRNYLPDLGVLIALIGLVRSLWLNHPSPTPVFRLTLLAGVPLILAIYAVATWVQAGSWRDADTLLAMQESYNPTSPRLQAMLAARAIGAGDTNSALAHIELTERYSSPREGMTSTIWRVIAYCSAKMPVPERTYAEFEQRTAFPITLDGMRYWEQLAQLVETGCGDAQRIAADGRRWIEHDSSPATNQLVWRSRYNLARIVATSGDVERAEEDARKAWVDSDYNNGIGVLLFQLNASLGRTEACEAILATMRRNRDPGNADLTEAINLFTKALKDGSIDTGATSPK